MTRLSHDEYLRQIADESARFRDVLAESDPSARVPSCPDWNADDLVWHLGHVQWSWARVVTGRPVTRGPDLELPERPVDRRGLLAFAEESSRALVEALGDADPADEAWTWAPEQSVGFTYRRQAHEAAIHRVDAEQTAGVDTTLLDAALAADGVAELIGVMYGGHPSWGDFAPLDHHVAIDLTDTGTRLWVQLGHFSGTDPEGGASYADEPDVALVDEPDGAEPDAVVRATASDVDLWLWQRRDDSGIAVTGDRSIYDRVRDIIGQPLN